MSQRIFAIPAEQSEQSQPATHNNLPLQPTPLIGRKQEAERICQSLLSPDLRLLTLTGPPGVGKTRLSLHVASSLLSSFPDGVFFINLAPISDHSLVASEIARTLEVREEDVARLSPLRRRHINMLGRYHFSLPEAQQRGELRPLRDPGKPDDLPL